MNATEDLENVIEILKDALREELDACGADVANDEPLCNLYVCQVHGCVFDKLCRLRKAVVQSDIQEHRKP